jgi:DNA polymerase III subunit chi
MTEVAFHFGAPDKIAYICRLLRKATGAGAQVIVVAPEPTLAQLDSALWGMGGVDFVPHCVESASASLIRHSPIVLMTALTAGLEALPSAKGAVVVQLCHPVPAEIKSYARVIEVVSLDESDRADARLRWKTYASWGMPIQKHDLALKE